MGYESVVHEPGHKKMLQDAMDSLIFRRKLAEDLGAAVLGNVDPDETIDSFLEFRHRLFVEQPDLFESIAKLDGRIFSIAVDGVIATHLTD